MATYIKCVDQAGNTYSVNSATLKEALIPPADFHGIPDQELLLPDDTIVVRECDRCTGLYDWCVTLLGTPPEKKKKNTSGWLLFRKHLSEEPEFKAVGGAAILKEASELWKNEEVKTKWNEEAAKINKIKADVEDLDRMNAKVGEAKPALECIRCMKALEVLYEALKGKLRNKKIDGTRKNAVSGWLLFRKDLSEKEENKGIGGIQMVKVASELWKDENTKKEWNEKAAKINKEKSEQLIKDKEEEGTLIQSVKDVEIK